MKKKEQIKIPENRKKAIKLICLIILTTFLIGCLPQTDYQSTKKEQSQEKQLEILEHKQEIGQYGTLKVVGIAKNTGSSRLSYAEVKVRFYNKEGNLIQTFMDNINDLDPGQTWKFEVLYIGMNIQEISRYEIGVGTLF